MHVNEVKLCATVADHQLGPRDAIPQVAFAGRSNVGKSSLLNALFGRTLALVSKTPGKTRTINYYLVNRSVFFVDLPGYGFAKVAQSERRAWGERITMYIQQEERLRLIVGLVDPRIPTSRLDVDQLGRGAMAAACRRLATDLELAEEPLTFSAKTGAGKRELLTAIADAVEVQ
jgi:GTP-binding protein